MTTPAAAPAQGPIAPSAPRAAPQPPADRFAFANLLDSLPSASAKAGEAALDKHRHSSSEPREEDSPQGQPASPSLMKDGALLASLPFALRAASIPGEQPQAAGGAPSALAPPMKAQASKGAGVSAVSSAKTATIGRLIGERTLHFGVSNFTGSLASGAFAAKTAFGPTGASVDLAPPSNPGRDSAHGLGLPQAEAAPDKILADAAPSSGGARVAASIAPRPGAPTTHRLAAQRGAAHEAAPGGRKAEGSPSPPDMQAPSSSAAHARSESSADGKRSEGRSPDPTGPTAPSLAQGEPFAPLAPASFSAGMFSGSDASPAKPADGAARASGLAAGGAPSSSPVREIDIDLAPGGLEDVSMTMRLAGDKLSVVIRAASSHTTNSIEGARDAIADRMAAIGQPLDSLIVRQTGLATDGNGNGNAASAEDGPGRQGSRSGQGGGSDDAAARRGHSSDRGF